MAYLINRYSGTEFAVLEDATIDTTASISLVGRNYVGYGEIQNENFLYLLENFANDAPPSRPISGQAWYNTTNNSLYAYDGTNWNIVGSATVSTTAPESPAIGAFWFKTPANTLYLWTGIAWIQIGPEVAEGFGVTKAQSTTILGTDNTRYPVIELILDGNVIAIVSRSPFTIATAEAVPGFTTISQGITMRSTSNVTGDLNGLADRATILDNTRQINGVGFNGSADITIKASTTNKLLSGDYISGPDFDGSSEITWSVDATASNIIGKVVARNSAGDFSAGTITANLTGNVAGNVTAASGTSTFDKIVANEVTGPVLSGNASTATRLKTPRTINGVSFDGTANVTVPAAAETLTGTTIAANVRESGLELLGTLQHLYVDDPGIAVGSGKQLELKIDTTTPALGVITEAGLKIRIRDNARTNNVSSITYTPSVTNLADTGVNYPSLVPSENNTIDFGQASKTFRKIYANNFVGDVTGNADTATLAARATSLASGGPGNIPYQTAAGTTAFIPAGVAGQVLRSSGSGEPVWGAATFATLNVGNYLLGSNYDGVVATTLNVDASSINTADKVVARDSSGNFAAGTITANLTGNVTGNVTGNLTGNSTGTHTGNVVGNVTGNLTGNADTASRSVTQAQNDNSTKIATTAYVDLAVANSRPKTLAITSPTINTSSPDAQFRDIIQAYLPANSVPSGTTFELIVNYVYAGSSSSFSAGRWIMAYRWGTASVSTSTTIYQSGSGYKLRYSSNGTSWSYTGTWSYV